MTGHEALELPVEDRQADPGANQLAEYSDSDDQFTDAQSGPVSPKPSSPVPRTRVQRVDDQPAHGEVPGTDAHRLREGDAKPDEIAIISDDTPKPSPSPSLENTIVPTTVVEEAPGSTPSSSEEHESKRKADAEPDIVLDSSGHVKEGSVGHDTTDTRISSSLVAPESAGRTRRKSSRSHVRPTMLVVQNEDGNGHEDDNDNEDFGDDFDDFEEGGEEDDFEDFEDGFQNPEPSHPTPQVPPLTQQTMLPFPIPDFDDMSPDNVISATEDCLASLFPLEMLDLPPFPPLSKDSSTFTTPRSASLWSQLVAPPPLAPPDWIRSRTRRLFLVSLGVPVDLDEILPASKQKKLILPSLNIPSSTSPRTSSDSRSVSRLRQGDSNNSSTSVDTQGKPRRKKGPPPQPEFDMVAARYLCTTTDEALNGLTVDELKAHVAKLEALQGTAKDVFEYWQRRTDEKISERETFEGVIENLVKHARKVRK